jgi:hypothetical protein
MYDFVQIHGDYVPICQKGGKPFFPLVQEDIFRYSCANMQRERRPWGASRIYYSIQGLRQEFGMNFLVTLVQHSRCDVTKKLAVPPTEYMQLIELLEEHTARRFQRSRPAYDRSLRVLECFVASYEIRLPKRV